MGKFTVRVSTTSRSPSSSTVKSALYDVIVVGSLAMSAASKSMS